MEEMKNRRLLDAYIKKYHIDACFSDISLYYPHMTLARFPRRTFLYTDSEFARYIYFMVEGRYKVYGNVDSGKRILYRFCQAFSILGEMEFILGPEERRDDNSVEIVEDCVALLLDYGGIKNQLRSDPVFLFFMCENLVEKSGYFGNMQLVNNLSSAQEKVARYLKNSSNAAGFFRENQVIAAEQLDISYRHFHRILKKFVENGWLRRVDGGYQILEADIVSLSSREQKTEN